MSDADAPSITVSPVIGLPEVRPGDDLAETLSPALVEAGLRDGDVVVVTSKIVSKAEGRLVPGEHRDQAVAAETVRVVARRGDLVISETSHGFVCANAGVDASNVDAGWLSLLPADPDATAAALRADLSARLGVRDLAVVVTDTFGRAWRTGVVNAAIGCAGLPAIIDLRGRTDDRGRPLEATEIALADEVAAASGLVIAKDARVPVAIVRGVDRLGGADLPARSLVRPPEEDLFRTSPLQALHDPPTVGAFSQGDVPAAAIEEAIRAASTVPAPRDDRSLRFIVLTSDASRRDYLTATATPPTPRAGIGADDASHEAIANRTAPGEAVLGAAPVLIVPWLSIAADDAGEEHVMAEREMLLVSGGAAIQNLMLALSAQGLASVWVPSSSSSQEGARTALGVDTRWLALGTVACGPMPPGHEPRARPALDPRARPALDLDELVDRR